MMSSRVSSVSRPSLAWRGWRWRLGRWVTVAAPELIPPGWLLEDGELEPPGRRGDVGRAEGGCPVLVRPRLPGMRLASVLLLGAEGALGRAEGPLDEPPPGRPPVPGSRLELLGPLGGVPLPGRPLILPGRPLEPDEPPGGELGLLLPKPLGGPPGRDDGLLELPGPPGRRLELPEPPGRPLEPDEPEPPGNRLELLGPPGGEPLPGRPPPPGRRLLEDPPEPPGSPPERGGEPGRPEGSSSWLPLPRPGMRDVIPPSSPPLPPLSELPPGRRERMPPSRPLPLSPLLELPERLPPGSFPLPGPCPELSCRRPSDFNRSSGDDPSSRSPPPPRIPPGWRPR